MLNAMTHLNFAQNNGKIERETTSGLLCLFKRLIISFYCFQNRFAAFVFFC